MSSEKSRIYKLMSISFQMTRSSFLLSPISAYQGVQEQDVSQTKNSCSQLLEFQSALSKHSTARVLAAPGAFSK